MFRIPEGNSQKGTTMEPKGRDLYIGLGHGFILRLGACACVCVYVSPMFFYLLFSVGLCEYGVGLWDCALSVCVCMYL